MPKLSLVPVAVAVFSAVSVIMTPAPSAVAELRPDKVHVADSKKTQSYIRDGLITGGDKAVNEVSVKDIRRATNPGYERVVIDLEGLQNGETVAIPRPPYYQVSVTPDEKRIVFTVWGKPRLGFDSRRVVNAFKKSAIISAIELLPKVEDNTWSFVFGLKGESPVEVFELTNPVRIIMDIKGDTRGAFKPATRARPKTKAKAKAKPKAKPAPQVEAPAKTSGHGSGAPGLDGVPEPEAAPAQGHSSGHAEEEHH